MPRPAASEFLAIPVAPTRSDTAWFDCECIARVQSVSITVDTDGQSGPLGQSHRTNTAYPRRQASEYKRSQLLPPHRRIAAVSRASRLLDLLQALRRRRYPVTAATLASELGVSTRTIYRDVGTLIAQGAAIEGEAGVGYVLRRGYLLPPLRFTNDELDALILGLRLVRHRDDEDLERAAADALAKISAVLPDTHAHEVETSGMLAGPSGRNETPCLKVIRQAIRDEMKLSLRYTDKEGNATERTIWPVAIGFFETSEMLAAWCEKRADFRHFRLDRIESAVPGCGRYPRRRRILLAEWRAQTGISIPY
ncbi:transcriptional regulator [Acetobacter nitrogenifigens DSM 23921 = NBRC 105050]|uniref:Transcriptional regulator n=1 Tax=Acetobacter nitrogenifigens DSM 23921 = NBRC 105050 TaxID=1120919 RepID=A0A511X665_9PROT|nr:YafY family protein [Acetobacter nitrogenifigens]GBQ96141.1 transcriptional regulator [Acetobacter nitrogenifigens DSM 23921 = NBRC 105050]GEN58432.1 hypothetical protein ANI02nite_03160 [Acetobacter nitrogenifigens DSM 23921 = NBRC 105050]